MGERLDIAAAVAWARHVVKHAEDDSIPERRLNAARALLALASPAGDVRPGAGTRDAQDRLMRVGREVIAALSSPAIPESPALTPPVAGLEEIEALCEKATPGPWETDGGNVVRTMALEDDDGDTGVDVCEVLHHGEGWDGTAVFLAACRTAVPALLARVKAAEARTGDVERECLEAKRSREDALNALAEARECVAGYMAERDEQCARADVAEVEGKRLALALEGMRGERDDEREISRGHEERAHAAAAEVARLRALAEAERALRLAEEEHWRAVDKDTAAEQALDENPCAATKAAYSAAFERRKRAQADLETKAAALAALRSAAGGEPGSKP